MKRLTIAILTAAALTAVGAGTLVAQNNPIAQRQTLLKEFGAVSREPGQMLRREAAFDLAKVKTALETYSRHAKVLPTLFPAGSFTGETAALPKIDENRADFVAIFGRLDQAATAALASITDEATFRANMGNVLRVCGQCHDTYRRPRT